VSERPVMTCESLPCCKDKPSRALDPAGFISRIPYSLIFTAHICTLKLGEVLRQVEGKDLPLDTEEIPVKALNTRHAE